MMMATKSIKATWLCTTCGQPTLVGFLHYGSDGHGNGQQVVRFSSCCLAPITADTRKLRRQRQRQAEKAP